LALARVQGPPGGGEEKVFLMFTDSNPFGDYYDYIDHHTEVRSSVQMFRRSLSLAFGFLCDLIQNES
jgi:hypothetical protein